MPSAAILAWFSLISSVLCSFASILAILQFRGRLIQADKVTWMKSLWFLLLLVVLSIGLSSFGMWKLYHIPPCPTNNNPSPITSKTAPKDCSGKTGDAIANGTGNIANSGNCPDINSDPKPTH